MNFSPDLRHAPSTVMPHFIPAHHESRDISNPYDIVNHSSFKSDHTTTIGCQLEGEEMQSYGDYYSRKSSRRYWRSGEGAAGGSGGAYPPRPELLMQGAAPTASVSNCRLACTAYPSLVIAINGRGHGAKLLLGGRRARRSRETLSALFSHGCCTTELQISSSWRRMRCENSEKKPHYIQRWLKPGTIRTADYVLNRARTHGRLLRLQRI